MTSLAKICREVAWWCGHCHKGRWEGWKVLLADNRIKLQDFAPYYPNLLQKTAKDCIRSWLSRTLGLVECRHLSKMLHYVYSENSNSVIHLIVTFYPRSLILVIEGKFIKKVTWKDLLWVRASFESRGLELLRGKLQQKLWIKLAWVSSYQGLWEVNCNCCAEWFWSASGKMLCSLHGQIPFPCFVNEGGVERW